MNKVKLNFNSDFYDELTGGRKNTNEACIVVVNEKKSKPVNYIANADVIHSTIRNPINLMVECHKVDRTKFGFKLTDKLFDDQPFFRFESAGTTHHNNLPDVPLRLQSITPPHFHRYDENGRPYAFKTDAIKDVLTTEAIIEDCFVEFCNETNTRFKDEVFPTIEACPIDELKLEISEIDPLKNIIFVP